MLKTEPRQLAFPPRPSLLLLPAPSKSLPALIPQAKAWAAPAQKAAPEARILAHVIDLALVLGFGAYFAEICTLLLVEPYMQTIRATGAEAHELFEDALDTGNGLLMPLGIFFLALAVKVVIPSFWGRSPGQALMGLHVEMENGERPPTLILLRRLTLTLVGYGTFGLLFLRALRAKDGRLWADHVTQTWVVKDR